MAGISSSKNDNMNASCETSCDGFDQDHVDIPNSKSVDEGKLYFSQLARPERNLLLANSYESHFRHVKFGITWRNSRVY